MDLIKKDIIYPLEKKRSRSRPGSKSKTKRCEYISFNNHVVGPAAKGNSYIYIKTTHRSENSDAQRARELEHHAQLGICKYDAQRRIRTDSRTEKRLKRRKTVCHKNEFDFHLFYYGF